MKHPSLINARLLLCLLAVVPALPAQGYPTLTEINNELQLAAATFPSICEFVDVNATYGTPPTWDGRHIHAVKISDNVALEEDEPSFFVAATHHGNEIVNPVIALDSVARLTQGYGVDPVITALVDDNEIWIIVNCNPDGYVNGTRHNANPMGTVDLNRNYPFLWGSSCNTGAKGVSPGSEPETQTIMALSLDQRFTKVLDFHSSGRETLYAYRQTCQNHQLTSYLESEAILISQNSGYNGDVRGPSSNGEQYNWQLGQFSNYAFLTETHTSQQPPYSSAVNEAATVWPGTVWMLQKPIPVWGHVTDSAGAPVEASISYLENPFTLGEQNNSEPVFGRYHAFLPDGVHTLRFEAQGFDPQDIPVTVLNGAAVQLEVVLLPTTSFALDVSTTGVGDLHLELLNLPPTAVEGYTIVSFNTTLPVGMGAALGINPDAMTMAGLATPAAPGNLFHWGGGWNPSLFPLAPIDLPAGTLSAYAGMSADGLALALDATWTPTFSGIVRITF